jgi:acyl carrier protein
VLPDYMVPTHIVSLEQLPLTENGKLNRDALPDPVKSEEAELRKYIAPRIATEEAVAHLWAEILDVDRVSVQDSFFSLGGHSLVATQLISRVRDTFEVDISMREFLIEADTVELLSALVDKKKAEKAEKEAAPPKIAILPRRNKVAAAELAELLGQGEHEDAQLPRLEKERG